MNASNASSPDLFQKLFEGMEDGCAICRMVFEGDEPVDWIYLAVNPAFTALTGLRAVVGRRITELLPGIRETSPDLFTIYGRVASTGRPEQVETFVEALNAWLSIQLFSPGPGQFIAIFRDTTAERQTRAQARLSERRFRMLFDLSPDPASLSRASDGTLIMVNEAWCALTGIPMAEAIGRSPGELGAWSSPEERVEMLEELRATGQIATRESRLRQRSGADRLMLVTGKALPIGEEAEVVIIGKDVTELRSLCQALEERGRALQRSEAQFQLLFQKAPLGMAIIDSRTGRYLAVNPRLEQILGYSLAELLDLTFMELTHPEHLPPDLTSFTELASGVVVEVQKEKRYLHRSGRIVWASVRMVSLPSQPGAPPRHLALIEDITERKAAEAEQARLQQRFYEAQKMESLGFLVAGVAHSINNVLAVALGTASMGERLAADAADRDAYQSIGRACMRGRDVVRSLIQFSKPTLSAQAPFELHALVLDVKDLLDNTTGNRIENRTELLPEPVWIHGDAGSLNLALMNLCLNAVEAMPGGGTLTLRMAGAGEDWVDLSIEDSGHGMSDEVMAQALEPFFTTKQTQFGSGLGLSVAYGVIKAHGGTLELASQPGRGTTVQLLLPRIPAPVQNETIHQPAPLPTLRTVLLVDDDEDVRTLMVRMLRKAGVAQVKAAEGGAEALALLESGTVPDLVILDQNMPGMSGVQVMGQIREMHPDLPILFSSGQPDIQDWECLKVPGVSVIPKPFTIEEIQARLADLG